MICTVNKNRYTRSLCRDSMRIQHIKNIIYLIVNKSKGNHSHERIIIRKRRNQNEPKEN